MRRARPGSTVRLVLSRLLIPLSLFALASCGVAQPQPRPAAFRTVTPAAMTVVRVAAGRAHACALMIDHTVRCWGHGSHGQLGIGALPISLATAKPLRIGSLPVPTTVVGLSGAVQIACGGDHSCALRTDGTVACWGSNVHGELGDGTTTSRMAPVVVQGIANATQVALGDGQSCARLTDGTVRCWGNNALGQLGDGTTNDRHEPVSVVDVTNATSVAVGAGHTCIVESGRARCFGANDDGQLGDGTTEGRILPTTVSGLTDVVQLALGDHHSCARLEDGSARCWGCGEWGQVGDGTKLSRLVPQAVVGLIGAIDLAAHNELTAASRHDGVILMWGRVPFGSLRDELGRSVGGDHVSVPSPLGDYPDVVEVALGHAFGCARSIHGEMRCFGDNEFGQHGNGTFVTPSF